jgi:tetratricopeptide (TPR) repeat protein
MLGEIEEFEPFTQAIVSTIDHSRKIQNKWLWTDNKPLEEPKEVMLGSVQDYVVQLYNTGDDKLLDNMKLIAETVLKHYPNHIHSLSNISIVYMIKGDHDKALEALLKAEKLTPKDYVVLGNIAQAYTLKGDRKNAIKYYELTAKYGNAAAKSQAKKQIQALKK